MTDNGSANSINPILFFLYKTNIRKQHWPLEANRVWDQRHKPWNNEQPTDVIRGFQNFYVRLTIQNSSNRIYNKLLCLVRHTTVTTSNKIKIRSYTGRPTLSVSAIKYIVSLLVESSNANCLLSTSSAPLTVKQPPTGMTPLGFEYCTQLSSPILELKP